MAAKLKNYNPKLHEAKLKGRPRRPVDQAVKPGQVTQKFLKIRCGFDEPPAIFSTLRANARSAYGRAHSKKRVPKMGMT